MSTAIPMDEQTVDKPLKESDLDFSAVSGRGIIEPADDERVLLKYSTSRPLFLTRVGVHFVLIFLVIGFILAWKSYYESSFNYWAQILNLERNWLITISICAFEKILNGFFGFIWSGSLAKYILAFHWIIHILTIMTFLIFVENVWEDHLKLYPYLLRLVLGALLLNSIVFVMSTLIKDNVNIYKAWTSFWLMTFANWIYLAMIPNTLHVPPFGFINYVKLAGFSFVFNAFFSLNAKFIVNYRTTKFYDDEDIYCYWAFWVDGFSFFWIDCFRSRTKRHAMTRLMHIKQKIDEKKGQVKIGMDS